MYVLVVPTQLVVPRDLTSISSLPRSLGKRGSPARKSILTGSQSGGLWAPCARALPPVVWPWGAAVWAASMPANRDLHLQLPKLLGTRTTVTSPRQLTAARQFFFSLSAAPLLRILRAGTSPLALFWPRHWCGLTLLFLFNHLGLSSVELGSFLGAVVSFASKLLHWRVTSRLLVSFFSFSSTLLCWPQPHPFAPARRLVMPLSADFATTSSSSIQRQ